MKPNEIAILALLLSTAGLARADQCQVVTAEQAKAALQLLAKGAKVVEYCEPCGDERPGKPQRVETVELETFSPVADPASAQSPSPPQKTVKVNGKEEDLAYLFIQKAAGDSHYLNVSFLAKCPAQGVSHEVDLRKLKAEGGAKPVQEAPIDGRP
jgi:hypothetical protein